MTFDGTTDEVRPVLVSAQLGESEGSQRVARTTPLSPASTAKSTASAPLGRRTSCTPATPSGDLLALLERLGASRPAASASSARRPTLELPLTASTPAQDRDQLEHDGHLQRQRVDDARGRRRRAVPNEALDGTKTADAGLQGHRPRGATTRATRATPSSRPTDAVVPAQVRLRRRLVHAETRRRAGYLEVSTRPAAGVDVNFELYDPARRPPSRLRQVVETGGAGQIDRRKFSRLSPTRTYWVRVTGRRGAHPQRGPVLRRVLGRRDRRGRLRPARRPDRLHRGRLRQRQVRRDQERLRRAGGHERRVAPSS